MRVHAVQYVLTDDGWTAYVVTRLKNGRLVTPVHPKPSDVTKEDLAEVLKNSMEKHQKRFTPRNGRSKE